MVHSSFPIVTKLNKINVKKKVKPISTFDFNTLYTTIIHKLLIQVLSEVINFVFKSKVRKRIAFLRHLSIGLIRELEQDTSLNKLGQCHVFSHNKYFFTNGRVLLNKILVYQWVVIQHRFGPTSAIIFLT